jgi:hypothetical protein
MNSIVYRATVGTPPRIGNIDPGNDHVRGLLSWSEQHVLREVYKDRKERMIMNAISRSLRRIRMTYKRTAAI